MKIKQKIHDVCFQIPPLKKLYCLASYTKGKFKCDRELAGPIRRYRLSQQKPVFLIFTPEHANLGDHAIAYAEKELFDSMGINYYEVTGSQLYSLRQYHALKILDHSTVFVNGGGNLGTLWPEIESMNRSLIKTLTHSTICYFPNSIFYENSPEGRLELQKSVEIYDSHPRLYLYAREYLSYQKMKELYTHVKFCPDMVLSLAPLATTENRSGCLICMRNDIEKTVSQEDYDQLCSIAKAHFQKVTFTSTVLNHNVDVKNRESELRKKLQEFSRAELVITDRLHGMIFCAVTGTKCIVFSGKSPKIEGCYDYLKNLNTIRLVQHPDEIYQIYKDMPEVPDFTCLEQIKSKISSLKYDVRSLMQTGEWVE